MIKKQLATLIIMITFILTTANTHRYNSDIWYEVLISAIIWLSPIYISMMCLSYTQSKTKGKDESEK